MIIPIGHEDMRGRRWPVITGAILVLNVLIFLFANSVIERQQEQFAEKAREAIQYYIVHPGLKANPPLDTLLAQIERASRKDRLTLEAIRGMHESDEEAHGGVDEATKAEQQGELDTLVSAMAAAKRNSPLQKYAYIPVENNFLGMITSQFLHGGWLHLIGNMLFLWLAGCNVEDRYGRVMFPLFYLSAGVVAALCHKAAAPHSIVPLIGASGAIAGAMGAFLINFARTRINFILILFFRIRRFSAPAYLMLPLWLLENLFYGLMYQGGDGGVAFWAHVGGFVYGAGFALALKYTGMEAKIDKGIEAQISLEQAPEITQAGEMIDAGRHAEAIDVLERFAVQQPTNIDAQLELLRAAKAVQDRVREKRAYLRLIGLYLQQNAPDTALDLYDEMLQVGLQMEVPPPLRLRMARLFEKNSAIERAAKEYSAIYGNGASDNTSLQAVLAHAQLALRLGQKAEAVRLFTMAQDSPVPHLDMDANIAHGLKQAMALPGGPSQTASA